MKGGFSLDRLRNIGAILFLVLAGVVVGAVVPPTSPATFSVPFPIVENQKVFTQLRAIQADGRISGVMNFANIVIA